MKISGKQVIYKEHEDEMDYCYLLGEGEVTLSCLNHEISILASGSHFGEQEWLLGHPSRLYTVKVKSLEAVVYKLSRESFM